MKLSVTVQHPSRKSLYVISMSVVFNVAMATKNFKYTQKSPKRLQKARNLDMWDEQRVLIASNVNEIFALKP